MARKHFSKFLFSNVLSTSFCGYLMYDSRGPRNNICYAGHVKYFSDWLIDSVLRLFAEFFLYNNVAINKH